VDFDNKVAAESSAAAAVLLFPFAWEQRKKVASATAAVDALVDARCFVVVVDQDALSTTEMTASGVPTTIDECALNALSALLELMRPEVRATDASCGATVSFTDALGKLLSTRRSVASFGSCQLMLTPTADEATIAATITAALVSAASTPFLAAVPVGSRLAVVSAIICRSLSPSVLNAARSVLGAFLPAGATVIVAHAPPGQSGRESLSLFFLQAAEDARWVKPVETPTATSDPQRAASPGIAPQRHWAALSALAGGTKQGVQSPVIPPAPVPPVVPAAQTAVAKAAVTQPAAVQPKFAPEALPQTDDFFDIVDNDEDASEMVPSQRKTGFLRWGGPREDERNVRQRANAVLANDRAASRTVVRLEFADGSSYEGEMRNGREEGTGRRVYANGHWYAGEWRDGQRHGWGVAQTASGRYEGLWELGRPVGSDADKPPQA